MVSRSAITVCHVWTNSLPQINKAIFKPCIFSPIYIYLFDLKVIIDEVETMDNLEKPQYVDVLDDLEKLKDDEENNQ